MNASRSCRSSIEDYKTLRTSGTGTFWNIFRYAYDVLLLEQNVCCFFVSL